MSTMDKKQAERFYNEVLMITQGEEGVILIDHTTHAPDEQDIRTVEWAMYGGWIPDEWEWKQHQKDIDGNWSDVDRADRLIWRAQEATDYLNAWCCPPGWWFGHNPDVGAYGVWRIEKDR